MKQSLRRIGLVARREFMAAVTNKGFVIGLLLMPAIIALLIAVFPRVLNRNVPAVRGEVAVVDPTGQVAGALRTALTAEAITARRRESAVRALQNAPTVVRDAATSPAAIERTVGAAPELTILDRPAGADLQREKQWLTEPVAAGGLRHIALVVVHPDAVVAAGRTEYGSYDLFIPENIDDRLEIELYDAIRESLVAARIRAHNLNREEVEAVMRVRRAASVTVAAGAERQTNIAFNRMLPFVFAGLLVFGVMIGGQTLLTQTVEEKSNRVIEVLLSAVSPIELMAGKILGQMAVSMTVVAPDVWIPTSMVAALNAENGARQLTARGAGWLMLGGRLKPGVSRAQASAEISAIGETIAKEFPVSYDFIVPALAPPDPAFIWSAVAASPIPYGLRVPVAGFLALLMSIVSVVLFIA